MRPRAGSGEGPNPFNDWRARLPAPKVHRKMTMTKMIAKRGRQCCAGAQHHVAQQPEISRQSGRKPRRDTAWSRQVLERGEPYYADDEAGLRAAFEDAGKLIGLGLGAVINVPVKEGARVLGTLNFLREAGGYRPQDVIDALELASRARLLFG